MVYVSRYLLLLLLWKLWVKEISVNMDCFQNINIKLISGTWMTTVISSDFPGLRTFAASTISTASTTSVASMTSTASFHQKNTDPDVWIIPSIQMIKTTPFFWNGSSKIHFLLISDTLSAGGCWGQQMLIFWRLVDETQISISPEVTRHHNSTKLLILHPHRAI